MGETLSCTLNRNWVLKTGVFMVVLLGFGGWALYDAMVLYPNRGLGDASLKLKQFLERADKAGYLRQDQITMADPRGELSKLDERISAIRAAAVGGGESVEGRKAAMEEAKYEWLSALERAWKLNPAPKPVGGFTAPAKRDLFFDPAKGEGYAVGSDGGKTPLSGQALLNELGIYWNATALPKPLSAFDMPVQWLFVVIGFGLGGYLLWLLVSCKAMARKYRFEPETQRLTLPNGTSVTPADLEDVDKRQWHKFFVTLITKDNAHLRLDLLRYEPLEEWVLAMEKTRFPERVAEEEAKKAAEEAEKEEEAVGDDEASAAS